MLAAAAVSAGSGIYAAHQNKGKPQIQNQYTQGPDFAANQDATKSWLDKLNEWGSDPSGNYGAIAPDWGDIWKQTQEQVHNYFNGTATKPGVNDQIDASFAQRGMGGDPASAFLRSQSGANESQQLGNLSAQQNIAKNQFAEQGRNTWLNSLQDFQKQTEGMAGNWSGAVVSPTSGQQVGNVIGGVGSGLAQYGIGQQNANNQNAYLKSILGSGGGGTGGSYAPGISAPGVNIPSAQSYLNL